MYFIEYTEDALQDLDFYRKAERKLIMDEVEHQLVYEPKTETRNRRRLRPNQLGEWELRIGKYRVFYDVLDRADEAIVRIVKIEAVGHKEHNKLYIRGEEYEL